MTACGSTSSRRSPLSSRSSSSAKTFSVAMVTSYCRIWSDRLDRSSPVSASTRYAAKSPALRRNSTLESDTSPQKKFARCSRTSSTTWASISEGSFWASRPWENSQR